MRLIAVPRHVGAIVTAAAGRVPAPWELPGRVALALETEGRRGRPVLWLAPALACGVACHLALPVDPPLAILGPLCAFATACAIVFRDRAAAGFVSLMMAAAVWGAIAAEASVARARAPRIVQAVPSAVVTGWALRVEPRADRSPRVLLHVHAIEGDVAARPARLVVSGRWLDAVRVGDAISIRVRLVPLPGPTHPGAYDPAFPAFFDGIGGYAFPLARPGRASLPDPPFVIAVGMAVEAWRTRLTERIVERLGPATGPIAAALVTGQRTAISEDLRADFNASGLMHVLSISGLHMALVAGGVFFLLRAGLAAIPGAALRWPVKKIAAVGALATAAFYEVASGSEVATTRSFVMITIIFAAILLDRPAFTMRNLMLAALLIVAVKPEAVLSASFQMSFAATAALVAGVERRWMPRLVHDEQPWQVRAVLRVFEAIGATAVVSLLCEAAILPIQLHHFHRVAWFGLVGNVLSLAVVDTLIMPAALATLVLLPFGVGDWVLPILGFGVDRMIDIAKFVASFPGAVTPVAGFSATAMAVSIAGLAWAVIWRTWIAALGFVPYLMGFALWAMERPPDLRISADGTTVAVRGPAGRWIIDTTGRDAFTVRRWLEADGDGRPADAQSLGDGRVCDDAGCTLPAQRGVVVAVARDLHALTEDCARAHVLILPFAAPPSCTRPVLVLDRAAIGAAQGLSVALAGGTPRVDTTFGRCGRRPWCAPPGRIAPRFGGSRRPARQ